MTTRPPQTDLPARFDPAVLTALDDPYPIYAALREADRTCRGVLGQIVVTRHKDVASLLRSPDLSNAFPEEYRRFSLGEGPASDFIARVLLHRDPPAHGVMRAMLAGPLHGERLPALATRIDELVSELLDRALSKGGFFDAVVDLAQPLPFLVICDLLGAPADDRSVIRPYAAALSRAFTTRASDEDRRAVDHAVIFLRRYVGDLLRASDEAGDDRPLMGAAARVWRDGQSPLEDVVDNLVFLFFAGFETTTNLIGTAGALLTERPGTAAQLRERPGLVPSFVEEVLRYDAPIQSRARVAVKPFSIGARPIRPGRVVLLLVGSANRDPDVFDRPDEFDIARDRNPHLSFGAGAHYCLGAQLARIEATALFSALLRRAPSLARAGRPERDTQSVFRSYRTVPLTYDGGPRARRALEPAPRKEIPMLPIDRVPEELAAVYRRNGHWTGERLGDLVRPWARRDPQRTAIVDSRGRWTYGELDARIDRLAAGLRALGIRSSDRVVVHLPNVASFAVVTIALFRLGAIPVFALPNHRAHEVGYLCDHAEAIAYITVDSHLGFNHLELARQVRSTAATLRHMIIDGDSAEFVSLAELERSPLEALPTPAEDVAFFLLSGGTTGAPKLIPRTHDDYAYQLRATADVLRFGMDDVYLAALPVAHNAALGCPGLFGALRTGGKVVMAPSPSPDQAFPLIAGEQVTLTTLMPPLIALWLELAPILKPDLSRVLIQVGSQRFPPELARRVRSELGARLTQWFGMAEGLLTCTRLDDPPRVVDHTQGRPLSADDEIRVVDADEREVARGEVGELLTRGPYTLRGYYKAADHNARAFTSDGFLRTGDLVRFTPEGNMVVEGRLKDVINRGGEKVSAGELEDLATEHPSVRQAAAVAMPDPVFGEKVALFLVTSGRPPSMKELRAFLSQRGLAGYKMPERLECLAAMPLTKVGKVDKAALRGMASAPALARARAEAQDADFDLTSVDVRADPYPHYARLRAQGGVHWNERLRVWLVSRHSDVSAMLRDGTWSSNYAATLDASRDPALAAGGPPPRILLFMDAPEHGTLRRTAAKSFGALMNGGDLAEYARTKTSELLEAARPEGVDVVSELASPLALHVLARVLGVPERNLPMLAEHAEPLGALVDWTPSAAALGGVDRHADLLAPYFLELLTRKKREPSDDVLSGLALHAKERNIRYADAVTTAILILAAGQMTSTHMIGNAVLALLRDPAALQACRAARQAGREIIDELLRFDGPVQVTPRTALADMTVGTQTVRRGQIALALLGSANRDEAAFPHPDRIDPLRPGARSLSFGAGPHVCIGAAVARVTGTAVLDELFERYPRMTLLPQSLAWRTTLTQRGLSRLLVALR